MNSEYARRNMVNRQIRPWQVLDKRVLDVIRQTPREDFVPLPYRSLAFADTAIPLAHGEYMLHPNIEGRILQSLDLNKADRILEVGTGSGYLTACLAKLAGEVESVDIHPDFTEQARHRLDNLNIGNATLVTGDASQRWGRTEQYNAIVISGSVPFVPDTYRQALATDGRLFAITGRSDEPVMQALLITRCGKSDWLQESLFDTWVPPLINLSIESKFEL